ncbi:hypothetical protein J5N97_003874 [Dioscorea zingiberensis]|uniref:Uncharacterized protein n=1 Tax=Dioscorea zingiberensis TaxID=325984 RepID=A0A9D5HQX0_9LILI|nr:hypothetical protein J5N97_003874 [Dioscorea zingiberensis]
MADNPPTNYKQRRFAVRDFPKGCGPNAPKLADLVKPVEETHPASIPDHPVSISAPKEVLLPNGFDEAASHRRELDEPLKELNRESVELNGGDGDALSEAVGVDLRKDVDLVKAKDPVLKKYPPPRRRNASAIRDFPAGCGSKPPTVNASEGESLIVRQNEKEQKQVVDGLDKVGFSERCNFEENQEGVLEIGARVVHPANPGGKSMEAEGKISSKEVECRSSKVEPKVNNYEVDQDTTDSLKAKNADGAQTLVMKPRDDTKEIVSSAGILNVEGEGRGNGTKQIPARTSEKPGLVRVLSVGNNGSENVAKGQGKQMALDRSVSDIKMPRMKHTVKGPKLREQERKPFEPGVTSPSEIKIVDRDAWSSQVRAEDKGPLMPQRNTKKLARKSLVRSEEDNPAVGAQGHEHLEACGDRLIVQALMSDQYCPWRRDKTFMKSSPHFVTPKNKVMKKGKASSKISAGEASYQDKSLVAVNDDEDSLPWEDESRQALVSHKRSCEFDVTLTPLGPMSYPESGGSEGVVTRNRVKKTLRLFQVIVRKFLQREESKRVDLNRINRIDLEAANLLKKRNEWVNRGKPIVGEVPGVEVGDEFHYRVELSIVGLHRPFQGGIDATKFHDTSVATSIVASGGYPDDLDSSESSDVLIYSGSGGNPQKGDKPGGDQKLVRGNLALKNSIETKTPVRVIYGFKELKVSELQDARPKLVSTYTYDGLYLVESYWKERGRHGDVFKFRLRRMPGQPDIGLKEVKKSKRSKVREGLCVKDISMGKEIIPICAVNTIDTDQPLPFKYITKVIYPSWYVLIPPVGCECTGGCSDSKNCACAIKNGGEIPFNFSGAIIQAKPLVYECGPSCKCPPSCYNRVSQHGIKIPLEVFKTNSRGWGVRSLSSIQSGSFICEYIGEMLRESEAEQRSNDEYLFDIGHNYDDQALWEGLSTLIPALQSNPLRESKEDVGFTIDAVDYGNVGRFINHSCSPNLYAQNVLYDHDDKRIPHIMFFAADNIPPLQELTYHYNYTIDQVRDSEGNIKRKDCYCGAPDCTGRLY